MIPSKTPAKRLASLEVAGEGWNFRPISASLFRPGEGPFRVRGLAYVAALAYVDRRIPGGRAALAAAVAGDPYAPYLDQIFVPPGNYDVSPLLRLHLAAAEIEGIPIGRFIEERSRASAARDARGMWKPLLGGASVRTMAERLPLAFNRYFDPCQARVLAVTETSFEGELTRLADPMNGLYTNATTGFVSGALSLAGAENVRVEWGPAQREGSHQGVASCRVRFVARWS